MMVQAKQRHPPSCMLAWGWLEAARVAFRRSQRHIYTKWQPYGVFFALEVVVASGYNRSKSFSEMN